MGARTAYIFVFYKGHTTKIPYWLNADGRMSKRYTTSYAQLRQQLREIFSAMVEQDTGSLDLHYITRDRQQVVIASDRDIQRACEKIPTRGTLPVYAYNQNEEDKESRWEATQYPTMLPPESERELLERFAIHDAACYYCHMPRIHGMRYVYSSHPAHSSCHICYMRMSSASRKKWLLKDLWVTPVPAGPLYRDEGDAVRHLQFLLTKLGYMKMNDTSKRVGCYRKHTEMAVEKFRTEYGIYSSNMRIYDRKTAKKLDAVVSV